MPNRTSILLGAALLVLARPAPGANLPVRFRILKGQGYGFELTALTDRSSLLLLDGANQVRKETRTGMPMPIGAPDRELAFAYQSSAANPQLRISFLLAGDTPQGKKYTRDNRDFEYKNSKWVPISLPTTFSYSVQVEGDVFTIKKVF